MPDELPAEQPMEPAPDLPMPEVAPEPAPVPERPLLEQMHEIYERLRARDSTIRKYDREIQREADAMRLHYQRRKVARLAQRKHEEWLREEAAELLRRKLHIKSIPGFVSRREGAIAFRKALGERVKLANQAAKAILNGETPP